MNAMGRHALLREGRSGTWRILRKLRCGPWRVGQLAESIYVLQIREANAG